MIDHPLARYLTACWQTHATRLGTKETAYYPALQSLLASAGGGLKPRVFPVMGMKDQGAGFPDGGLFTPDQFVRGEEGKIKPSQMAGPSRGVVECKSPTEEVADVADTDQVSRYWRHYKQVLVTNYRDFRLIGTDSHGVTGQTLETYRLADSEAAFWVLARDPDSAVAAHGDRLIDFLRRCLRRPAPLSDPKDVAWFLASYARESRGRLDRAADTGHLAGIRKALEEALGLHVQTAEGEQFFRSALVQTLFYGLFAAWVLWHRTGATEAFDWEKADKFLKVPILRKLFRELTSFHDLTEMDLTEPMGWAADALARVDRVNFFAKFQDEGAVQYFYEPFLEAFDPAVRKQLGVWYTPPEVVRYMVGRVDRVLRERFDRPDGLADPGVYVLDPCCGTGAFLVEVLKTIRATLEDKGEGSLTAAGVKDAAINRVFGFEIMPAPFVVAHLQLGLLLQTLGAPLDGKKERPAVYLTNALTGWDAPDRKTGTAVFQELAEERDLADRVKQQVPLLVVLGNPPYNGFAGLPAAEDAGLVDPYRTTAFAPPPEGQGLNDLYVRFLRIAERAVSERGAGHGIVCYISNYSWLDGRSYTGLRERLLTEFDELWVDCLNGDKFKTGKQTPDGKPDPSVFSTPGNREGIQVGTAVALLARTPEHVGPAAVRYRDFWGEEKREELIASLKGGGEHSPAYLSVTPLQALGLAFRPMTAGANYTGWPLLPELFPVSYPGVKTSRDEGLVDIDRNILIRRMEAYFDPKINNEQMEQIAPKLMADAARFVAATTRESLQRRGLLSDNFVRFIYRPFDVRWLYWESTRLLDRPRPDYFPHVMSGNVWLGACQQNRKDFDPPIVCQPLAAIHIIERTANMFPLLLRATADDPFAATDPRRLGEHLANLSPESLAYLTQLGRGVADAPDLFHHAIAVLHAPRYSADNMDALRQDWPRIPLPASRDDLLGSATLGRRVATLLDPDMPADGVTAGKVPEAIKKVGEPVKRDGSPLADADCRVTARWGIAGKGGVTMPGTGKVETRPFAPDEAAALGPDAVARLGPDTVDVFLNDTTYWRNIPRAVWEYQLGGYQVLKKWLSYREAKLLGRGLTLAEVKHVRDTARRIAALLLMGPALDANYAAVAASAEPPTEVQPTPPPSKDAERQASAAAIQRTRAKLAAILERKALLGKFLTAALGPDWEAQAKTPLPVAESKTPPESPSDTKE